MLGKSGAVKAMKEVSEEIISKIDSRGFSVGDNIDLKDTHELPYLYERGTIFYKEYKKDQLPSNEVLISDLKKMVDIYEEYIDMFLASIIPSGAELNFPSTPAPLLGFHG